MRTLGLIGLVLALLIVGLLVKKQMAGLSAPVVGATGAAAAAPSGDVRAQSQQIQQQFKQSLDQAMQPRPTPDDK
jgi:hypothetical protein